MPIDEYGRNSDYVSYFPLEEYVDKIKLNDDLLFHLEDTNREFDEYMNCTFSKEEYINRYYEKLKSNNYLSWEFEKQPYTKRC